MIQVHLTELFARPEIFHSFLGRISLFLGGPPAAPVFMVVMGIFLSRTGKTPRQLLVRGAMLFGGGFLLNAGLNAHLFVRIALGHVEVNPWEYFFGVDILFLAGMSVGIIALFRPLLRSARPVGFLAALALSTLALWAPDSAPGVFRFPLAFLWAKADWSYFPLVPWLAWPLAGYSLGMFLSKPVPRAVRWSVLAVSAVVVLVAFPFGFRVSSALPEYYHHGPLFFLWTLCFVILWAGIFAGLNRVAGLGYLKWLGRNVTAAYVFQWLLVGNIATAIYRTRGWGDLVAWFLAIVLAVSLLVLGWERLRETIMKSGRV